MKDQKDRNLLSQPVANHRRQFVTQLSALAALSLIPMGNAWANGTGITGGRKLRYNIGYAAITWNGKDEEAIRDVAGLKIKGMQLRANLVKVLDTDEKLTAFKKLLSQNDIKVPVFSGGNVDLDKSDAETLEAHTKNMKLAKALGAKWYQLTNNSRPKDGTPPTEEMLRTYAAKLITLGKEVKRMGMVPVYHNHMHQLGETPLEVDIIMQALKGSEVKLLLDVAHYAQGGGDVVKAIAQYSDVLMAVHLKDVKDDATAKHGYRFVELGQGRLNIGEIVDALENNKFRGWAMIELDSVPDPAKTPLQCATTSVSYLRDALKLAI